jgi:IclR family acetate operon transcriptional repressor
MAVKQVRSGARVLATFEAVAHHQPVGVGALARALGDDKSAVQRALMTLAESGWIRRSATDDARWELTTRMLRVSHEAYRRTGLTERTRRALEDLRDETGETVVLNVPEDGQIVVVDVVESAQLVRTVPTVGLVVPALSSAAGTAVLAALTDDDLARFLGGPPAPEVEARVEAVRRRGWSVNDRDATPGASAVGAAILDGAHRPIASIAISAPAERMGRDVLARLGPVVAAAAARLSAR